MRIRGIGAVVVAIIGLEISGLDGNLVGQLVVESEANAIAVDNE